jgi:mannose-6-phosphate isomerase-like protein (cupin superfamily)
MPSISNLSVILISYSLYRNNPFLCACLYIVFGFLQRCTLATILHYFSSLIMSFTTSTSERDVRPVVLHTEDINGMEDESFPDPSHGIVSWKTLFSSPKTPTDTFTVGIGTCPPGSTVSRPMQTGSSGPGYLKLHHHAHSEIYYIIAGKGLVSISGIEHEVKKGSVVFSPGSAEHGIRNMSNGEKEEEGNLIWLYAFAANSFGQVVYKFDEPGPGNKGE